MFSGGLRSPFFYATGDVNALGCAKSFANARLNVFSEDREDAFGIGDFGGETGCCVPPL